VAAAAALFAVGAGMAVVAAPAPASVGSPGAKSHVLLISVDGLHASDLTQCVATGACPNLAALAHYGNTYTRATTSKPSDSSPGLVALTTGADPKLAGVYYDDSYDRTMFAPPAQLASGTQDCTGPAGAEMQYFENLDVGAPTFTNPNGTRTILNESIDPAQVPRGIVNGQCVPIYPNDFNRVNSIFSVAHAAGLRTAWADKHPSANSLVAGNGTPDAVDDPFQTEINADIIPPTLQTTRVGTVHIVSFPRDTTSFPGAAITDSVGDTESYDQIKVDAILNQIDGWNSGGTMHVGVPAIFGMNFQAVSVGQKLVDPNFCDWNTSSTQRPIPCQAGYTPGGYLPGSLVFTPQLKGAIGFVDTALGSMVKELRAQHLLSSTEIVITSKHGQSPIDPAELMMIGGADTKVLSDAGVTLPDQTTDDDVSLMWYQNPANVAPAVAAFQTDQSSANTARIQTLYSGASLEAMFGDPAKDPRTPDIIIQPIPGSIYSGSVKKVAEHGGFSEDDTHVAMLVVDGARVADQDQQAGVVTSPVQTAQVAPTVLAFLGLNPAALDSVQVEHVQVLPGLVGGQNSQH
jgi:hypothetical protein